MEGFESKWVNSILNIIGVNSLRLGGLQLIVVTDVIQSQSIYSEIVDFWWSIHEGKKRWSVTVEWTVT